MKKSTKHLQVFFIFKINSNVFKKILKLPISVTHSSKQAFKKCQSAYQNEAVRQFNKYASLNELPKVKASRKYQISAVAHAKEYAADDSFESDFYYYENKPELKFSQITFREKKEARSKSCTESARVNIAFYLYTERSTPFSWENEIEIGCGINVSKSKTTYGVCHISPPIN